MHEATFSHEDLPRAKETGHSTALEAAQLAAEAGVRRLVLTHISPRYSREAPELAAEARAVFPETTVARDGMEVEVGFIEEGRVSGSGRENVSFRAAKRRRNP